MSVYSINGRKRRCDDEKAQALGYISRWSVPFFPETIWFDKKEESSKKKTKTAL
jgi:hypothetical protein